jgi:hypothetical protein
MPIEVGDSAPPERLDLVIEVISSRFAFVRNPGRDVANASNDAE